MMRYVKTDKPEIAAIAIGRIIKYRLSAGQKVAWFLSGGSAITVAVLAAQELTGDNQNLSVILADERYGPPGHPESNWTKLRQAGFSIPGAKLEPVLEDRGARETAEDFNDLADRLFRTSDYRIGLLGIGPDGHTAGILPGSPAVLSKNFVCYYQAPDFQRLTLTPKGLPKLDEAVVYAVGREKKTALENLGEALNILEQPAQVLKQIPTVTIYNDLKGEIL